MSLKAGHGPSALEDDREDVQFMMNHSQLSLSVLVSCHALEAVVRSEYGDARVQRFNQFRQRFERIACEKLDKGFVGQDRTVCIRGRGLPGRGC